MHPEPDYESYSEDELIDVYENIDRENYPDRFKKVKSLLAIKVSNTEISEHFEEVEVLNSDPIKKAQRINDFFDSLNDSGVDYRSGSCDGFDGGSDSGGGDCGGGD
ncbi:hypothetical protein [Colwellia psychrerythraea]|uniref:Uncharacterized protein n=1 Tax=Colwellia psychrerythraea TaxID=28229 RepID=A0A099KQK0_COLPS|nr:hypothetical protein [Colwellia psychrerythraea]KGJ91953.1 hypothetical protein ND2E_3061 [Colwellia psychrerythraea]